MSEGIMPQKKNDIRGQIRRRSIDGQIFKRLIEAGLAWLKTNAQVVNALNVFPVPDGDTGTNMVLTMQAACAEIANSPEKNLGEMSRDLAQGALMGARGNSGVILSQLWRGFARALDEQPRLSPELFCRAFAEARDTAYRGVVRPVEGTILTVAKDMAAAAEKALQETRDLVEMLERIVAAGGESVERTPDLLPVLKEAGVVDSGGKGLFYILEGMLRFINGDSLEKAETVVQPLSDMVLEASLESIEPGQDFEVIVDFRPSRDLNLPQFYSALEEMGTSIQVGEGDGMYRVHIHVPTDKRYEPIDYTMNIGTITKVHIENLIAQMEEIESQNERDYNLKPLEAGHIGVVAVAPGPGIARVFASLGVAAIVEGGQTMNPSTQELLGAFENLPTNQVIILPNNKNIIMAAESAAKVTVKEVAVIPSRTVPQGLAAMLCLNPEGDFYEVVEAMNSSLDEVETGEITTATRSVEIDGVKVQEGQIIALHNGDLIGSAGDFLEGCLCFLDHLEIDDYELITLFYGVDISKNEVNAVADQVRSRFPDQEVEVQEGGQPHYQFIIAVE